MVESIVISLRDTRDNKIATRCVAQRLLQSIVLAVGHLGVLVLFRVAAACNPALGGASQRPAVVAPNVIMPQEKQSHGLAILSGAP
jgi:hypothetical protein